MDVERWRQRSLQMRSERFSGRVLDAGGRLDARTRRSIRDALELHGAVHVSHTGFDDVGALIEVMPALGFGPAQQFSLGGRTSHHTQQKWAAPGLRRMDFYPPHLHLLANNEVQYRRSSPRWVLFGCLVAPADGGRVFLHSATAVQRELERLAPDLLARMLEHGLSIETGFLEEAHPAKAKNSFQSWQERFETKDRAQALARATAQNDECDTAWWGPDDTLMTRITLTALWRDERGDGFLRFPRVALDGPTVTNGFRRFPLGNGDVLTPSEEDTVREALLSTREGVRLDRGDLVLFDNLRFGHSRESFSGEREVLVGMAGEVWDPVRRVPVERPVPAAPPRLSSDGPVAYTFPPALVSRQTRFSARTFDAGGALDAETIAVIRREFATHGALVIQHTGIRVDAGGALPTSILDALGFGRDDAFPWGGQSSGRTTRRALSPELRATDDYPPHLWLLPHNEVLYQRSVPARLLFFSARAVDPDNGGRTFVHSAAMLERHLVHHGGATFLEGLRRHGLRIEMGFIDERHPQRSSNYFRSWQERFGTDDRDEAARRCREATHQFDECWWKDEGGGHFTLMTRVRVPAFHDGHLLFPRIALDAPSLQNGHRRYPRGDGVEFTRDEVDLLLHAFLDTREGVSWNAGDLLLVDNLRYGHSREAFEGPRSLAVAMAGSVTVGPLQ